MCKTKSGKLISGGGLNKKGEVQQKIQKLISGGVMVLCLHNRSSQTKLMKIGKADEAVKVTENRRFRRHFLSEILLKFGATAIVVL